jgi:hypothetical protein
MVPFRPWCNSVGFSRRGGGLHVLQHTLGGGDCGGDERGGFVRVFDAGGILAKVGGKLPQPVGGVGKELGVGDGLAAFRTGMCRAGPLHAAIVSAAGRRKRAAGKPCRWPFLRWTGASLPSPSRCLCAPARRLIALRAARCFVWTLTTARRWRRRLDAARAGRCRSWPGRQRVRPFARRAVPSVLSGGRPSSGGG